MLCPPRPGRPHPWRPGSGHPPSVRGRGNRRIRERAPLPSAATLPSSFPSSRPSTHALATYPSSGVSIGLWSFCPFGYRVIDRNLRDVGGVVGRPREAVDDRGEREELLPLLRGDVVGQSVDQFLVAIEVIDRLVRRVDVRGEEREERLVENRDRGIAGGVQFLEQPRLEAVLGENRIGSGDPFGVIPDALEELRDESVVVQLRLLAGVPRGSPGGAGRVALVRR